ncbi:MAG: sodium:alanine symporter family protein [Acutalibacteraceae bacterium]|nr:sodium:alanine symporter family protein [Acutalibacteraceae bacterium]
METLQAVLDKIGSIAWGPGTLILLVGTGIFLTFRFSFLPWRNLFPFLKRLFSKESRQKSSGDSGDISPFSALMTALASTIGTGNIVGVATAMVAGGPGALVWMWISAAFGITTKFAECALATKYRVKNEKGEMLGGPMYSIRAAFNDKLPGKVLAVLFAVFALLASFGIGNMTQANSISAAVDTTFGVSTWITGIILMVCSFAIVIGGIQIISKVSSVLVPVMAIFYILAGLIVVFGNIQGVPQGVVNIFSMAFTGKAVAGGIAGTITATILNSMRYGVGRGVFSNEAGMGSAAITAAAATTDSHIRQGYISMCGTFIDTILVCTITGLAIASSGMLGVVETDQLTTYKINDDVVVIKTDTMPTSLKYNETSYLYEITDTGFSLTGSNGTTEYTPCDNENVLKNKEVTKTDLNTADCVATATAITGVWTDSAGNHVKFTEDGSYEHLSLVTGVSLTILAFRSVLGDIGAFLVTIGLILFAFSTILGWEYNGEKSLEYLLKKPIYCYIYRVVFSLLVFVGATISLDIVWSFSDIANALMIIPNLIALILLSGKLAKDTKEFQKTLDKEKQARKALKKS